MSQTTQTSQRVWTKDDVLHLIATNATATARALTMLYNRQTAGEQEALATVERNGRGFNGRDAHVLSDIARKLPRYNNHMTPRQLAYVRKALTKYHRQVLGDMEERGLSVEWPKATPKKAAPIEGMEPAAQPEIAPEEAPQVPFGAWA